MTNQKLAPGSYWVNETVINTDGTEVSIDDRRVMFCDKCGESTVDVTDTLAVIDRANLDPVRVEARRLVELSEKLNMEVTLRLFEFQRSIEELKAVL